MKPTVILPILTAVVGFGAGWLLKPAPAAPQEARKTQSPRPVSPPPGELVQGEHSDDRLSASRPRPNATPPDQTETKSTPQSLDDAKLARLTEILKLTEEQQQEIVAIAQKLGSNVRSSGSGSREAFEKTILSSDEAAATLEQVLTPEQSTEFAALRKRSTENSIENQVQKRLSTISNLTDVTPEQREKLAAKIREDTAATYLARPDNFDLLLDTSPLPMGTEYIANASVDRLMADALSGGDAEQSELSFRDTQRQNLDTQLDLFKDILTPAQQARMKLDIDERKAAMDRLEELTR